MGRRDDARGEERGWGDEACGMCNVFGIQTWDGMCACACALLVAAAHATYPLTSFSMCERHVQYMCSTCAAVHVQWHGICGVRMCHTR